jgi:hypothetical protein
MTLPALAEDLICEMLDASPANRPTLEQIRWVFFNFFLFFY